MNILILGPESRNRNIRKFLEARHQIIRTATELITLDFLWENNIDLLISFGYGPILRPPITEEYKNRIINIHPAFLPEGRGMHPNFWSFFEGRTKGVSIHFIDDGIDTGDLIARKEFIFDERETLKTSYARLDREVEALFFQIWDDIVREEYELTAQGDLHSPFPYRNRYESEKLIDLLPNRWDTSVKEVEDLGADFFCGAAFWEKYDQEIWPSFANS